MSQSHAAVGPAPAVAYSGQLHTLAPAESASEREADRFADAFVAHDQGPGWAFGQVPVHQQDGRVSPDLQGPLRLALEDDVSDVRIHTDRQAEDLTARAGASAVTVGRDISFAPGKHDVRSRDGVRRLAHEVAHATKHSDTGLAHRDGNAAVTPATTLEGLEEADRKRLQVVTNTQLAAPTKDELKNKYFEKGTTLPRASDTTIVLDKSVPAALTKGITNLAGDWSIGADPVLKANTTITIELDLSAHGGGKAPYRFTFNLPAAAKGKKAEGRIIVEQLGAAAPVPGAKQPAEAKPGQLAPPDPVAAKLKAASITASGYSTSEDEALRAAVALVPDAHLSAVSGLKFGRKSADDQDAKVAGRYLPKEHKILMYDNAFAASGITFVQGGTATSYASRLIVHEIGHAVDLRALGKAYEDLDAASNAVNAASGTFNSADEKKKYDDAVKAETAAKKTLKDTRSRSGTKTVEKPLAKGEKPDPTRKKEYEDVIGTVAKGVPFRDAVKKDGKDVSKYGEEDWQESYAEAYSLYITSPDLLKSIRPATYDYLSKDLPK